MIDQTVALYESNLGYLRSQVGIDEDSRYELGKIVEHSMDRLLAAKTLHSPFNVVVRWTETGDPKINMQPAGLGDLVTACKVATLVRQNFPHAHVFLTNRFRHTEQPIISESSNLVDREYFADRTLDELLLGVQSPWSLPAYLSSHYYGIPTIMLDVGVANAGVFPFDEENIGRCKNGLNLIGCYHIDQYNSRGDSFETFIGNRIHDWFTGGVGLSPINTPCVGIHVDPQLDHAHIPYAELGNLSDQELANWFKVKSDQTPQLYFGYFSKYDNSFYGRFFNTVMDHESRQGGKNDVEFVFLAPGRHLDVETNDYSDMFEHWRGSDFHSVELVQDGWPTPVTYELNSKGQRKLRVILWTKKIPRNDVLQLMKASGKPVLVSGDHTLAEGISLTDRVLFYEMQHWKQDVPSEMVNLATHHYGEESKLVQFLGRVCSDATDSEMDWTERCGELSPFLSDPEFLSQYEEFMRVLQKEFDINQWLTGKLKRCLIEYYSPGIIRGEERVVDALVTGDVEASARRVRKLAEKIATWVNSPDEGRRISRRRTSSTGQLVGEKVHRVRRGIQKTYLFRNQVAHKVQRIFFPSY